jgi:hypothetical protein
MAFFAGIPLPIAAITPKSTDGGRSAGVIVEQQTVHGSPCMALVTKLLKTHRNHCDAPCRTVYDKVMRGK